MDCARHAFNGCAGDDGETCRDCPGRAERAVRLADINARHHAERAKSARWINLGIAVALASIFTISALAGLSRAETAFQQDARR